MVNKITTVLGVLLIAAASYSVFRLDKVMWLDASFGIGMGVGLIYTKNSSLSRNLFDLINNKKDTSK